MAIEAATADQMFEQMKAKLSHLVPEPELRFKADIAFEINRLKKERGAIILGHNYMEAALFHSVCDVTGDSLELSRKAAETKCDPIVFCGVRFMAETAKILNPERTVLLPAKKAGCSLAESVTAENVRELRRRFPGIPIVTYINTYADVKAECDIVCTSGNAAKVVRSLNTGTVIFLPDEYLGKNVAQETGRTVILATTEGVKELKGSTAKPLMIGWRGRCEVHEKFTVEDIRNARRQFPDVVVLAHPECSPEVIQASDFSASTSRMVDFVKQSPGKRFLLLTECSMGDNIVAENPDKEMVRMCSVRCPHMNEITLEDTLRSLRENQYVIEVPPQTRERAKHALDRMLQVH